ncbi:hypothetical protein NADE_006509 [Nannochloris sp. 'desiccata']|nr:hypothetical protein NADE_006509 [Chlorella desiccata (nom. nud.)]
MKTSAVCLLLLAGFAAQASALTIGEAVDGLCPDAKARLAENTVLGLAITAAKDVEITLPAGDNVVVVAPSDAAFIAALAKVDLTAEEILADADLLTSILSLHLAAASTDASVDAATLAGSDISFMEGGEAISLADLQTASPADLTIMEGDNTVAVEEVVTCDAGATVVFVDTVLLPGAAPASAPTPAPAPTPKLTIGALVGSVCPDISAVLGGDDFSTLFEFLTDPEIAATEITLPEGVVVVAAPTNDAFKKLIAAVGPAAAANKTIVTEILANHIATATAASDTTATALSGETMGFWTEMGGVGGNMAPVPTGIAALVDDKNGVITDTPVDEMAKVVAGVACAAEGQYAFAIDTVLVPEKYTPKPAPGPGAAPAPAPSAAGVASMGFAAVAAVAAAMLA